MFLEWLDTNPDTHDSRVCRLGNSPDIYAFLWVKGQGIPDTYDSLTHLSFVDLTLRLLGLDSKRQVSRKL